MSYIENFNFFVLLILLPIIFMSFFMKRICDVLNLYDAPNSTRKIHKKPVLLINGFIILVSLNFYFLADIFLIKDFSLKLNIILIILLNSFYFLGYKDDIKNLTPRFKSAVVIAILLIFLPLDQSLVLKSLKFENLFGNEIHLHQAALFITIFFIYIFYNFLNFIDGINGVAISVTFFFVFVLQQKAQHHI